MPRIFKGSESTLRLLISKTGDYQALTKIKIKLYTTDIENAIEVIDGIEVDDNIATINLAPRAFMGMEDGLINYIIDGVTTDDVFHTERQSNYMLKTLSYINEDGVATQTMTIDSNGEYRITPNDGLYVDINVNVPDLNGSYEDGYEQGKTEGFEEGKTEGYGEGFTEGKTTGFEEGKTEGYGEGFTEGVSEGIVQGLNEQKSKLTNISITQNGEYTREDGYNRVNVNVPQSKLQDEVSVTLNGGSTGTINPSTGYDAMKKVIYTVIGGGDTDNAAILDFSTIGYDVAPLELSTDLEYSKSIYDKWTGQNMGNYPLLVYAPLVDTSSKTSFENFFYNCKKLKYVPMIDTSNGTSLRCMFQYCSSLTEISAFNTSNVVNMESMFFGCSSLEEVPLLDTSKVTDMTNLFYNCSKLTTVPHFNTSRVENMTSMFNSCRTLKTIPQFDTKRVTTMDRMFFMCDALESVPALDMGNIEWNQQYLYVMSSMNNLTYIGGFPNMVASWDNNYGLCKCPNLTKESCLDILNSLVNFYDKWGEEPDWDNGYGVLKVHKNFINHVGNDISIAIDKGWNIIT
jgi:surface protein